MADHHLIAAEQLLAFCRARIEQAVDMESRGVPHDGTYRQGRIAAFLAVVEYLGTEQRGADSARGWEERLRALEIRRSEMRMLLARLVRYVRRDTHPIALRDFSEKVADYLDRTHEPADILRELPPPPTSDK